MVGSSLLARRNKRSSESVSSVPQSRARRMEKSSKGLQKSHHCLSLTESGTRPTTMPALMSPEEGKTVVFRHPSLSMDPIGSVLPSSPCVPSRSGSLDRNAPSLPESPLLGSEEERILVSRTFASITQPQSLWNTFLMGAEKNPHARCIASFTPPIVRNANAFTDIFDFATNNTRRPSMSLSRQSPSMPSNAFSRSKTLGAKDYNSTTGCESVDQPLYWFTYGEVAEEIQRLALAFISNPNSNEANTEPGTPHESEKRPGDFKENDPNAALIPLTQILWPSESEEQTEQTPESEGTPPTAPTLTKTSKVQFCKFTTVVHCTSHLEDDLAAIRKQKSAPDSCAKLKGNGLPSLDTLHGRLKLMENACGNMRLLGIFGGNYHAAIMATLSMDMLDGTVVPLDEGWSDEDIIESLRLVPISVMLLPVDKLGRIIAVLRKCKDEFPECPLRTLILVKRFPATLPASELDLGTTDPDVIVLSAREKEQLESLNIKMYQYSDLILSSGGNSVLEVSQLLAGLLMSLNGLLRSTSIQSLALGRDDSKGPMEAGIITQRSFLAFLTALHSSLFSTKSSKGLKLSCKDSILLAGSGICDPTQRALMMLILAEGGTVLSAPRVDELPMEHGFLAPSPWNCSKVKDPTGGDFLEMHEMPEARVLLNLASQYRPTVIPMTEREMEAVVKTVLLRNTWGPSRGLASIATKLKLQRLHKTGTPSHFLFDHVSFQKSRNVLGGRLRMVVQTNGSVSEEISDLMQIMFSAHHVTMADFPFCLPMLAAGIGQIKESTSFGPLQSIEVCLDTTNSTYCSENAARGKMLCRGYGVPLGFFRNVSKTKKAFTHSWYRTNGTAELSLGNLSFNMNTSFETDVMLGEKIPLGRIEAACRSSAYIHNVKFISSTSSPPVHGLFPPRLSVVPSLRGLQHWSALRGLQSLLGGSADRSGSSRRTLMLPEMMQVSLEQLCTQQSSDWSEGREFLDFIRTEVLAGLERLEGSEDIIEQIKDSIYLQSIEI